MLFVFVCVGDKQISVIGGVPRFRTKHKHPPYITKATLDMHDVNTELNFNKPRYVLFSAYSLIRKRLNDCQSVTV